MKRTVSLTCALLFVGSVVLLAPGSMAIEDSADTSDPAIQALAGWTFMVYLDADNNLEYEGIEDFLEMASVGSSSGLDIVVQMDRWDSTPGMGDDARYGDWTDCRRFLVTADMEPWDYEALSSLGEVNMGDPTILSSFVQWGITTCPAERYALVIWDHGAQWQGVCWDDSEMDRLTIPELDDALATSLEATETQLSVLCFDACGMGGFEVLYEVWPRAERAVASEIPVPLMGLNYAMSLERLDSDPGMDSSTFSSHIVEDYVNSYSFPVPPYYEAEVTMSSSIPSLMVSYASAVNDLAACFCDNVTGYVNYLRAARSVSSSFTGPYGDETALVDANAFFNALHNESRGTDLMWYASSAEERAYLAVENHRINDLPGGEPLLESQGMTIYFPASSIEYSSEYSLSSGLRFVADTMWDEMLEAYYSLEGYVNSAPVILSSLPAASDLTCAQGADLDFSVVASDPDGNVLSYWLNQDGYEYEVSGTGQFVMETAALAPGTHYVDLLVTDGELYDSCSWTLEVTENTPPVASVEMSPTTGFTYVTMFEFDPSGSYDVEDPDEELQVSWRPDDWDVWTQWMPLVNKTYVFDTMGGHSVSLMVRDSAGATSTTSIGFTVRNLDAKPVFEMSSDKSEYAPGETASIFSNITNPSSETITLTFFTLPYLRYYVRDVLTGTVVYWSYDHSVIQPTTTYLVLESGETHEFDPMYWSLVDDTGSPVPLGYYEIVKDLENYDYYLGDVSVTVAVTEGSMLASLRVTPSLGSLETGYMFYAGESTNSLGTTDGLTYRWDWETDGVWDEASDSDPLRTHKYDNEGNYTCTVKVIEPTGVFELASVNVSVDATPPSLSLSVANGTVFTTPNVNISVSASDSFSGLAVITFSIEHTNWIVVEEWINLTFSVNGTYELSVVATDQVGNHVMETIEFVVAVPQVDVPDDEAPADDDGGGFKLTSEQMLVLLSGVGAAVISAFAYLLMRRIPQKPPGT